MPHLHRKMWNPRYGHANFRRTSFAQRRYYLRPGISEVRNLFVLGNGVWQLW